VRSLLRISLGEGAKNNCPVRILGECIFVNIDRLLSQESIPILKENNNMFPIKEGYKLRHAEVGLDDDSLDFIGVILNNSRTQMDALKEVSKTYNLGSLYSLNPGLRGQRKRLSVGGRHKAIRDLGRQVVDSDPWSLTICLRVARIGVRKVDHALLDAGALECLKERHRVNRKRACELVELLCQSDDLVAVVMADVPAPDAPIEKVFDIDVVFRLAPCHGR